MLTLCLNMKQNNWNLHRRTAGCKLDSFWKTSYSCNQIQDACVGVESDVGWQPGWEVWRMRCWRPVASYTYNSGPVPNSDILTDHSMCLYNRKRHWDIDFCWQGLRKIRVLDPPRGAIYILPLACSLEASLHLYMSYFIFGEDKQIKHMIPAESYRRRNVKNAIDLAGEILRLSNLFIDLLSFRACLRR